LSIGAIRLLAFRRREGSEEIWEAEWADGRPCIARIQFQEEAAAAAAPARPQEMHGRVAQPQPPGRRKETTPAAAFDPTQTAPDLLVAAAQATSAPSETPSPSPAPPRQPAARGLLQARLTVGLSREVTRLRLQGFLQRWNADVVREKKSRLVVHLPAPQCSWLHENDVRPMLELQVKLARLLGDANLTEVRLFFQTLDGDRKRRHEIDKVVGPLLLDSIRSHFEQNSNKRGQERLPWYHSLCVWPVLEDGSLASRIDCQGKDISLDGIGFYSPGELISNDVCLFLPATAQTQEALVAARVVRTQPHGDGWYHVGATLIAPWRGPSPVHPAETPAKAAAKFAALATAVAQADPPRPKRARRLAAYILAPCAATLLAALSLWLFAKPSSSPQRPIPRAVERPDGKPSTPAVAAPPPRIVVLPPQPDVDRVAKEVLEQQLAAAESRRSALRNAQAWARESLSALEEPPPRIVAPRPSEPVGPEDDEARLLEMRIEHYKNVLRDSERNPRTPTPPTIIAARERLTELQEDLAALQQKRRPAKTTRTPIVSTCVWLMKRWILESALLSLKERTGLIEAEIRALREQWESGRVASAHS
jgi:hypothetical protein